MCFNEIREFATLVKKYQMFDEAGKVRASFYKAVNEKKGMGIDRGKPCGKDKGKNKDFGVGSKPSGEGVKWFKCGVPEHFASDCKKGEDCYKCGKAGHKSYECKGKEIVCCNCAY